MAAKAEGSPAIPPDSPAPAGDPAEQLAPAGEYPEKRKEAEKEGEAGSREAKRRRTCPARLEKFSISSSSSPPAAAEGEESGGSEQIGISLSFSFDTKGLAPIETTPKFGSFNGASDLGLGLGLGKEEEEDLERSGGDEGKIGI